MAKVVLISGSPRAQGNTMQIVNECAKILEEQGLETVVYSLAGRNIRSCVACFKCREIKNCVLEDGLDEIINSIRESDGFIIAAPVYFGTARGDLMSALQRIGMTSRASDKYLSRKVGGPIAIARRGGHTLSLQEMLMFYLINDMIVVGSDYWNMVFGMKPGEVWSDEEGIATIRKFAKNVAFVIDKLQ